MMQRKIRTEEPAEKTQTTVTFSRQIQRPPVNKIDRILNYSIGILSLVVVALVISLVVRLNATTPESVILNEDPGKQIGNAATDEPLQVKSQAIRVEVLNGSGVPRLAAKAKDYLQTKGFDVVQTGNASHTNYKKSIVQDRIGNIQNALQVANALGISESGVVQQKNPQRFVEVTVILGADYKSLKIGD